jgi:outer membrane protein TolC
MHRDTSEMKTMMSMKRNTSDGTYASYDEGCTMNIRTLSQSLGRALKLMVCVGLLLLVTTAAYGQTITLTLDSAIALGLANSTSLKSKQLAVSSSREGVSAAKSGYYPWFQAGANWAHFFQQTQSPTVSFVIGEDTLVAPGSFVFAQDPITFTVDLQQPLYTFGRLRSGVALAEQGLNLAKLDLTEEERSFIVEIKRAFYGYILAKEVLGVQEETLNQRLDTYELAKARREAGLVADFEVLSAESDVEAFRPDVISASNNVELALLGVLDLLDVGDAGDFDIELIGELEPEYHDFQRDEMLDKAIDSNFSLKQYRTSINLARYQESLKRNERKPIIGAFSNYTANSTFDTSTGANDYTNWDHLVSVGVNVSIPLSALLPYSRETAEKNQSSLDLAEVQMNLSSIESSIRLGVDSILLRLNEEKAKIQSTQKNVELASELYESARIQFENGLISRLELKEAQLRLNGAQIAYLSSVYNHKLALYDLADAVGVYEF